MSATDGELRCCREPLFFRRGWSIFWGEMTKTRRDPGDGYEMSSDEGQSEGLFGDRTLEISSSLSPEEVASRMEAALSAESSEGDEVAGAGLDGRLRGRRLRLGTVEQNQAWGPILKAEIEEADDGSVVRGRFRIPVFAWLFGALWVGAVGWMVYAAFTAGEMSHLLGAAFMVGCGVLVVGVGISNGKKEMPKVRSRLETAVGER